MRLMVSPALRPAASARLPASTPPSVLVSRIVSTPTVERLTVTMRKATTMLTSGPASRVITRLRKPLPR